MVRDEFFVLSNGVKIPKIALGTWQIVDTDCYGAVKDALDLGYRHIDTAYTYQNEKACGRAIKDSGIKREEIFVTTKLPADVKTYDECEEYFYRSLENLGLDYIDLFLIHAPWPWQNQGADYTDGNIEVWKKMIELYEKGVVRAIGVSNFNQKDIEALVKATNFMPMVNQIRYFIGNTQDPISRFCKNNQILVEAYSPLATGELLGLNILDGYAEKYNVSKAQICLRYCIQKGVLPLAKSIHKDRMANNLDIDFTISDEDMLYFDSLYHIASTRKFRD